MKKITLLFLFAIISASVVFGVNDTKYYEMKERIIGCGANLTYEYRSILFPYQGYAELPSVQQVRTDMKRLNNTEWGSRAEFNNFTKYNVSVHVTDATSSLRLSRKAVTSGIRANTSLTQEQRLAKIASINETWRSAAENATKCRFKAYRAYYRFTMNEFNDTINKWNATIEDMEENGYNVSGMKKVYRNSTKKLGFYIHAINAKNTSAQASYREQILDASTWHLPARFNIARLTSIVDKIERRAIREGYEEDVAEIREELASAAELAVEGRTYLPGELEIVWSNIEDAADGIRELVDNINRD